MGRDEKSPQTLYKGGREVQRDFLGAEDAHVVVKEAWRVCSSRLLFGFCAMWANCARSPLASKATLPDQCITLKTQNEVALAHASRLPKPE